MYFVMYVSHDVDQANAILREWLTAGIRGATILESSGLQRLGAHGWRDDLSILPSLNTLLRGTERQHRTLFTIVEEEALLEKVVQATTQYVEDWSLPDVGILVVLPVLQAYGLGKGIPK